MDAKEIEKNYNRKYTLKRKESKDLYNKEYHAKNYKPKEKLPQPTTCRHHPDRERIYRSRLCRECYNKRVKVYKKKSDKSTASSWEELNLKDFLHDSKLMDVKNLHIRYQRSYSSIFDILKKYGITPKQSLGSADKIILKNNTGRKGVLSLNRG